MKALVDTGAPHTLFDRGVGDALNVQYRSSGQRRTHTIAGGHHLAQVETASLTLSPFDDLSWETDADFFVNDWGMPYAGVLGQQGFLDRWVVTFNYADRYFVVEEPETFRARLPVEAEDEYERRDLGWHGP